MIFSEANQFYTLINWVGGQRRNILPAAFSVLTDRRKVSAEKAKGNIFLHWTTFIALLINPTKFIGKMDHVQQNSQDESSCELCWSTEIKFIFCESVNWNILLKLMLSPPRQG